MDEIRMFSGKGQWLKVIRNFVETMRIFLGWKRCLSKFHCLSYWQTLSVEKWDSAGNPIYDKITHFIYSQDVCNGGVYDKIAHIKLQRHAGWWFVWWKRYSTLRGRTPTAIERQMLMTCGPILNSNSTFSKDIDLGLLALRIERFYSWIKLTVKTQMWRERYEYVSKLI